MEKTSARDVGTRLGLAFFEAFLGLSTSSRRARPRPQHPRRGASSSSTCAVAVSGAGTRCPEKEPPTSTSFMRAMDAPAGALSSLGSSECRSVPVADGAADACSDARAWCRRVPFSAILT